MGQYAQHVEYRRRSDDHGECTRVRIDITVEPVVPVPEFQIRRACGGVLDAATTGLRQPALRDAGT